MSRNLFTIADSFAAVGTRSTRASKELPVCLQGCLRIYSGEDVTDNYGHQTGDIILKELAAFVVSHARKVDLVARYGGEEFTIVFPETDKQTALNVAEKIRR